MSPGESSPTEPHPDTASSSDLRVYRARERRGEGGGGEIE